jgi:hypothetical protein
MEDWNRASILDKRKRSVSSPQRPDRTWGPTQPLIQWVPGALSPRKSGQGVKLTIDSLFHNNNYYY